MAGSLGIGLAAMAAQLGVFDSPRGGGPPGGAETPGPQQDPVDNQPEPSISPTEQPTYDPEPASPSSKPSPEASFRSADPNVITAVGIGPFRTGEPVDPLLEAGVARRPSDGGACDSSRQLVSTKGKYDGITAWQDGDEIRHVTIFNDSFKTRSGLRVGSTPDEIKQVDSNAREYEGEGTLSYLIPAGGNGLLFIITDGETKAIVVGPRSELDDIANAGGGQSLC